MAAGVSRPRYPRKDANHADIESEFRARGFSVLDVSRLAGDRLDLVVGKWGITTLVEIKDGDKVPSARKLKESEQATFDTWLGRSPDLIEYVGDVAVLDHQMRTESVAQSAGLGMAALSGR